MHMMSVVRKSTCSGLKTGLYISYHGGNAFKYIKQRDFFFHERSSNFWLFWYQIYDSTLKRTNFTQFWRPKICQFFNLEQGNFCMTLVICVKPSQTYGTVLGWSPLPANAWRFVRALWEYWIACCYSYWTTLIHGHGFVMGLNQFFFIFCTLGLGACFSYAASIVVINTYFSKMRPLAFGLSGMGGGLGSTVLPILSISLIHHYGWRGIRTPEECQGG